VPRQSFAPIKQAVAPASSSAYDAANISFPITIPATEAVQDLAQLVRDTPEGFWLGSFGFRPVVAKRLGSHKEGEEERSEWGEWEAMVQPVRDVTLKVGAIDEKAWRLNNEGVLGEFSDLVNVFGGGAAAFEGLRRGLQVVPSELLFFRQSSRLSRIVADLNGSLQLRSRPSPCHNISCDFETTSIPMFRQ
jgi:hypothetical protein